MPRLFTAIELPDEVRDELVRLKHPLPGAKWVSVADLHLTLRFAGDISKKQAEEFAFNVANIEFDVFELQILGLGAFGGNTPHTLWAGVEPSPALEALQRAHERAARSAGLAPEARNFAPHVTLARFRGASADIIARYLNRMSGYRSRKFFVEQTVLMSSKPKTGGGPYAVEEEFPLRGASFADTAYDY